MSPVARFPVLRRALFVGAAALLWSGVVAMVWSARHAAADSAAEAGAGGTTRPSAADDPAVARAAEDMARAASAFWASLTPEQQAQAGFAFTDEQRFDWHFIPRQRKGLPWRGMTPAQQALGHAFLSSGLSQHAYAQAETIMSLEQILKEVEQGKGPERDAANYSFSVFGTPGPQGNWGWRVEGHHLSLNFTIAGGRAVAAGPVFFGTNPAEVKQGPRQGLRVIAVEEDLGRELVKSLSDEQRKRAVTAADAPKDIITGHDRKANPGAPVGIAAGEMTPAQRKVLTSLIEVYARRLRPELAEEDLRKIDAAGADKVYFAWAGGLEPGEGHYYRIHGPTFLVEFDDTQDKANHIHSVWRDAANDFGEDILRRHYEQGHAVAR